MDELKSKARALVDAGRFALRASEEDRERIEAALRARLGTAALPVDSGVAHVASATGWRVAAKFVIGVGLIGTAGVVALRPSAQTPAPRAAQQVQTPLVLAPTQRDIDTAPSPALDEAVAAVSSRSASSPAAVAKRPVAAPAHAADRLAQEVALLSRATTALRAGHAAQALKVLDEHQRKFASGALSEDRRAAKAQALCVLGQPAKGRAELALLPPHSPVAARAAQVCDAGSLATPTR